jgi:2,4-dienoyl-CoA reductase-like NADH-dependent reductase (Old Yellow Enzyme family)
MRALMMSNACGKRIFIRGILSPVSNIRKSDCCGSIVNRYRFIIEVVTEIAEAIYKQSNLVRRFKNDRPIYFIPPMKGMY